MAKSSTHIAPGGLGYFAHNSRESFSQSQVFFDEKNELWNSKAEAFTIYRRVLKERSEAYTNRTGQKLQKKTVTHLSSVINLEAHHTLKDIDPLVKWIEKELDTKALQISIHRDEGKLVHRTTGQVLTSGKHFFANPKDKQLYFDKEFKKPIDTGIMGEWDIEKNIHAHVEYMGLTSEGKSIKRELTKHFFRQLQDKTAEVLGMERGTRSQSYSKEQMKAIKGGLLPKSKYENDKAYGEAFKSKAKELGIFIDRRGTKRKDTHEYKEGKAKENEASAKVLAKLKDVQAENTRLWKQLKERNASRADHAELEMLMKQLKSEARAKDLTIDSLQEQIHKQEAINILEARYKATLSGKDAQIANLKQRLTKVEEALDTSIGIMNKALNIIGIDIGEGVSVKELNELNELLDAKKPKTEEQEFKKVMAETQAKVRAKTSKKQNQGLER